jgi:glycosyltransferase involved in cell wall biosynthesis
MRARRGSSKMNARAAPRSGSAAAAVPSWAFRLVARVVLGGALGGVAMLDAGSNALLWIATLGGAVATHIRLRRGTPRSVWGITPILTLPLKARCDRLLGIGSQSLVFHQYYISQTFDINLSRLIRRIHPRLHRPFCRIVFAFALIRYDIFHYFADRGFLPSEHGFGIHRDELRALRAAGKRLYVHAYGADVRTRHKTLQNGRWNICMECPAPGVHCICDDGRGGAVMAATSAAATALIAMGDMSQYMPGSWRLDYWPVDTDRLAFQPLPSTGTLRVAHAPNHPFFKGTRFLVDAIERLRAEGEDLELVRVEGVPNDEVLRLFASAVVVADQFVAGSFGYTMLEAMAIGRPVLCFIRESQMPTAAAECPVINTNPDTLYDVLKWCLANRQTLVEIGQRSRRYVERHHSLAAVAMRFGDLYQQTAELPVALSDRLAARCAALAEDLARYRVDDRAGGPEVARFPQSKRV